MRNFNNRKIFLLILIIIFSMIFAGCSSFSGFKIKSYGNSTSNSMKYTYGYLNGEYKVSFYIKKDVTIEVDYDIEVEKGNLVLKLIDSDGNEIWTVKANEDKKGKKQFKFDESGRYKIIVDGNKTKGSFNVKYNEVK
ncbi:hypothetical protein [Sporosalibacterium faouarense]|uniref:hypothetical protein n=1 Tax=Sporosalibacterium faouarense TaxID=516123 RepID=UPI00141D3B82|nr:hypothetical protein [Sporosalibacterium faouarense]MTI47365.1 hypothetical protein [Bacillota bacterium]